MRLTVILLFLLLACHRSKAGGTSACSELSLVACQMRADCVAHAGIDTLTQQAVLVACQAAAERPDCTAGINCWLDPLKVRRIVMYSTCAWPEGTKVPCTEQEIRLFPPYCPDLSWNDCRGQAHCTIVEGRDPVTKARVFMSCDTKEQKTCGDALTCQVNAAGRRVIHSNTCSVPGWTQVECLPGDFQ